MAKAKKEHISPPSPLPPSAPSQRSFPSPDMHRAHGEGFPLISSSPPGNQHFNNSLSVEEDVWCFYAHHHPSSFLSLISQHPSESEAKTSLGLRRTCLSCPFYKHDSTSMSRVKINAWLCLTDLLDCIVILHKSQPFSVRLNSLQCCIWLW